MTTAPAHAMPPTSRPERPISPERRQRVEEQSRQWIARLFDASRRNNLLYYRPLKLGTLDLGACSGEALNALVQGGSVPVERLLPSPPRDAANGQEQAGTRTSGARVDVAAEQERRLKGIERRARANFEERGVETLFIALGLATWTPDDGGSAPRAPVLLLPVRFKQQGRALLGASLVLEGEISVNTTLLHLLRTAFGCEIDADDLLAPEAAEEVADLDAEAVFARLRERARRVPGFAIDPVAVLANFSYQKLAMVNDLRDQTEALVAHDVIAALAGDASGREGLRSHQRHPDPHSFDRVPPDNEHLVLDADASQQQVVEAALHLQSGVVQGPPGTGKSQTIANLIASLAAAGKRVLFVAEKRAALDVVKQRLVDHDLGHLLLDLHGTAMTRVEVARQFGQSLQALGDAAPVDAGAVHNEFSARRRRLVEHEQRLHTALPPLGLSVYELQGSILQSPDGSRTPVRWRGAALTRVADDAERLRAQLRDVAAHEDLFWRTSSSPWLHARLTDGDMAQAMLDRAVLLYGQTWRALRTGLQAVCTRIGCPSPSSVGAAADLIALLESVAATLAVYSSEIYAEDLAGRIAALEPAGGGAVSRLMASLTDGGFRSAQKALRALRHGGKVDARQMREEAQAALAQREAWQRLGAAGAPEALDEVAALREQFDQLIEGWQALARVLPLPPIEASSLAVVEQILGSLAADSRTPQRLPHLLRLEAELEAAGAGDLLGFLRERRAGSTLAAQAFDFALWSSALEAVLFQDAALAGFTGRQHDETVRAFGELDRERLRLASARVRRMHAERAVATLNQYEEQAQLVRREVQKQRRHLPIRTLMAQAPEVLTALRPCWMASPLSVSQLLPPRQMFDVVIFDEASQVLPEDAVPALLRAPHAIVAGDNRQLPPTTFFAASDNDEADEEATWSTAGFESLLDSMAAVIDAWWLNWHYRSRDESLIAFSNRHIYDNRLTTFPGATREPALRHVLVDQAVEREDDQGSVAAEVRRVVELILEHAEQRPHETLGVIAMGIKHADRVQLALDEALVLRKDLQSFFDTEREERFFIKNLERVQGDERDAIILTVGYGKSPSGRLLYRFGPLQTQGGERRLNVAITRARSRMTVVSSFTHLDMDPTRSTARGVELLRLYLQYVASQGTELGERSREHPPLNPFELNVYEALKARGVQLVPQWGAARYRIDFAVQHPRQPGRMILAIECDGASYHSAPTARERDRLRQQQLERLGWRFHRIWSTDWFNDREAEITRALAAVEAAVAECDVRDARVQARPIAATPALLTEPAANLPSPVASNGAAAPCEEKPAAAPVRGLPRPPVFPGMKVTEYPRQQLVDLARWIMSDGRLRTDEEIIEEMMAELGFKRRGSRIESALTEAIAVAKART